MAPLAGMSSNDENRVKLPSFQEFVSQVNEWHEKDAQKGGQGQIAQYYGEKKQESQDEFLVRNHGSDAKKGQNYQLFGHYLRYVSDVVKSNKAVLHKVDAPYFYKNEINGEVASLQNALRFDLAKWENKLSCLNMKGTLLEVDRLLDYMLDEQFDESLVAAGVNNAIKPVYNNCGPKDFNAVLDVCTLLELFVNDRSQSRYNRVGNMRFALDCLCDLCDKSRYISGVTLKQTKESAKLSQVPVAKLFLQLSGGNCPDDLPPEVKNRDLSSLLVKRYGKNS